jgi:hypothetical protein
LRSRSIFASHSPLVEGVNSEKRCDCAIKQFIYG